MFYLSKEIEISASHSLDLPYESPCENLHGHNYKVTVFVSAEELNAEGMVMDFAIIKSIVTKYDHAHLNDLLAQATAECLANKICRDMNEYICNMTQDRNSHLYCSQVDIQETEGSFCSYVQD